MTYLEEAHSEEGIAPVFKLVDLAKLYQSRLEQLGVRDAGERVHTTRLKNRLLAALPDLSAHSEGRNVLLTFDEDIGPALKKALNHDSDAVLLAKAAQFVRKAIFSQPYTFNGSFQKSQQEVVPSSLLALVSMILNGPNILQQAEMSAKATTAALTVSQVIIFNSVKHSRSDTSSTTNVRHNRDRETPLTIYLAMKCHSFNRSRTLVETLFNLGLCISYDRLLQITADMANGVCRRFQMEQVVCPPKMRQGLFTTCAVDNIDHNPSSMTAHDSFHGTAISAIQHPTHDCPGIDRGVLVLENGTSVRTVAPLPSSYTEVPPAALKKKEFTVPPLQGLMIPSSLQTVIQGRKDEFDWLKAVMVSLEKERPEKDEWLSWAAYHASLQKAEVPPAAITAMLPMFLESAHSVAMVKHSMDIIQAVTKHVNPSQIPVLTADQPLYALAKQIQWSWPTTHGEDHFVVMFGGLHIEMAVLKVCIKLVRSFLF